MRLRVSAVSCAIECAYAQSILPTVDARDRVSSALATTRAELILEALDRRQESLGRRVALKTLSARPVLDAHLQKRFEREAQAAARLHHTNIVPIFGVGHEHGVRYYVMQLIDGDGLDRVLTDLRHLHTPAPTPTFETTDPPRVEGNARHRRRAAERAADQLRESRLARREGRPPAG